MMCVSLYAGRTVEALLQEPAARGGWADLNLQQRVEVAREVLAGGLHALSKLRPWVSCCCQGSQQSHDGQGRIRV